jgi:hypothetical protein
MNESIREELRKPDLNPFSDNFSAKRIDELIDEIIKEKNESDDNVKSLMTLESTHIFNQAFVETFDFIKTKIKNSELTVDKIANYLIAVNNRQYQLLTKQIEEKFKEKTFHSYLDVSKEKIKSIDKSIGEIEAESAVEGAVDSLNILLNYLRYFTEIEIENNARLKEIEKVDIIKALSLAGNFYDVLKKCYDDAIWNDGFILLNFKTSDIEIQFDNPEDLKILRAGFIRLRRNSMGFYYSALKLFENNNALKEISYLRTKKYRKHKRIKFVQNNNGEVVFKLADGTSKNELDLELKNECDLVAYYPYLENIKLKDYQIDLEETMFLFNQVQHLFRISGDNKVSDDSIYKTDDFNKFPYYISTQKLREYLQSRTTFSNKQINDFFELIVHKQSERINLWKKPFLRKGDFLFFTYLPVISPMTVGLIDNWIENSGLSLKDRGTHLENYIKKTIDKELSRKGFFFKIPNRKKYKSTNGNEEIDLIIILKSIIVFCEIKCIKFPMMPRDYHNSIERLKGGAEQIVRKTKFILENQNDFIDDLGDISNKEPINIVITNYPLFTGFSYNNVPIIDFFLLDAYINSGTFTDNIIVSDNGKTIFNETIREIKYYNDEEEFCANFESNMKSPFVVKDLMSKFKLKMTKITPENFNYKIHILSAEMND